MTDMEGPVRRSCIRASPREGDEPTCGAAVRSTEQVSLVLLTSSDPEQEEGPRWPEVQACREGSCSPPAMSWGPEPRRHVPQESELRPRPREKAHAYGRCSQGCPRDGHTRESCLQCPCPRPGPHPGFISGDCPHSRLQIRITWRGF